MKHITTGSVIWFVGGFLAAAVIDSLITPEPKPIITPEPKPIIQTQMIAPMVQYIPIPVYIPQYQYIYVPQPQMDCGITVSIAEGVYAGRLTIDGAQISNHTSGICFLGNNMNSNAQFDVINSTFLNNGQAYYFNHLP